MLKKFILLLAVVTSITYAGQKEQPTFNLQTINGKKIEAKGTKNGLNIPSAKGKVILLEFWGTHCPPCLFSIPHYIELTKKYKDRVEMFAIEVQMTPTEQLKEFVKSKGINYNVFNQKENMDFVRYLATRAGWRGAIPYLIILDTNGNVVDIKKGMVSQEYVEKVIQYILNKDKQNSTDNNTTKETNSTK